MALQRRSSGEGSVFQRADGYWCGAIRTGGKRRVVYAKTRKAVAEKLATLQQAANTGKLVETSRLTVAGFLTEWLETRRTNLRPSTWASYEELLRLHVIPMLGDLRLQNLRPLHLVRLYADRQQAGVSARRTQMGHLVLHKALADATRWQVLPSNPAASVSPPKPSCKERKVWTEKETMRFLRYTQEYQHTYDPLWVFLLGSGCRLGEALGLHWTDWHEETKTVHIVRAITHVHDKPCEGEPKTRSGRRQIMLPVFAVQALQVQRDRRGNTERVFTTASGLPPSPTNLRRIFHRACIAAGVPILRIHDLRAMHATLAVRGGTDIKSLQRRLGHASLHLTLQTYVSAMQSGDAQAAKALDQLLNPDQP